MPFNFLNLFRLVFSILYFQSYAVIQTSTRFPFLAVQRNISFNPMQLCELRLTTQTTSVFQSYAAAWTTLCQKASKISDVHSFNLMLSILCSRVGYVGNSAQRLHFLHNIALCILLSFGAVMVVCC